MIDRSLITAYCYLTNLSAAIGAIPWRWNSYIQRFEVVKKRRWIFALQFFRILLQLAFFAVQIWRLKRTKRLNVVNALLLVAFSSMYVLMVLIFLNMALKKEELVLFFNRFITRYGTSREGATYWRKFKRGGKNKPKMVTFAPIREVNFFLKWIFTGFTVCSSLGCIGGLFAYLAKPRQHVYWSSLVLPYWNHWIVVLALAPWEGFTYLVCLCAALVNAASMVGFLVCLRHNLRMILTDVKSARDVEPWFKAFNNYACAAILTKNLAEATDPIAFKGHQVLTIVMVLCGTHTIIGFWHVMIAHPAMFLVFVACTGTCIGYQLFFYRFTMDLFMVAKKCMSIFISRIWSEDGLTSSRGGGFRGLPKLVGPFRLLKLPKPPQYLRKMGVAMVKMQVYFASGPMSSKTAISSLEEL